MSRRSPPQRDIDDRAFPIRVKVRVPPTGLGTLLADLELWLAAEVFPGEYAHHHSQTLGGEAMAFYFRRIEDAFRFIDAFPHLELADSTTSPAYTSPLFPKGHTPPQPAARSLALL